MPLGTDFSDWEVQLLYAESMLPELGNMSDLSAGLGPQDAGVPDIVMPEAGCGMAIDPWDIDLWEVMLCYVGHPMADALRRMGKRI